MTGQLVSALDESLMAGYCKSCCALQCAVPSIKASALNPAKADCWPGLGLLARAGLWGLAEPCGRPPFLRSAGRVFSSSASRTLVKVPTTHSAGTKDWKQQLGALLAIYCSILRWLLLVTVDRSFSLPRAATLGLGRSTVLKPGSGLVVCLGTLIALSAQVLLQGFAKGEDDQCLSKTFA